MANDPIDIVGSTKSKQDSSLMFDVIVLHKVFTCFPFSLLLSNLKHDRDCPSPVLTGFRGKRWTGGC